MTIRYNRTGAARDLLTRRLAGNAAFRNGRAA